MFPEICTCQFLWDCNNLHVDLSLSRTPRNSNEPSEGGQTLKGLLCCFCEWIVTDQQLITAQKRSLIFNSNRLDSFRLNTAQGHLDPYNVFIDFSKK